MYSLAREADTGCIDSQSLELAFGGEGRCPQPLPSWWTFFTSLPVLSTAIFLELLSQCQDSKTGSECNSFFDQRIQC
eukprot:g7377.t1